MSNHKITTYATVAGVELDDIEVEVDVSPPERDVNFAGDLDICAVMHNGRDVIGDMSDSEVNALAERMDSEVSQIAEDDYDALCDWQYQNRKDMALEMRAEALEMGENQRGVKLA